MGHSPTRTSACASASCLCRQRMKLACKLRDDYATAQQISAAPAEAAASAAAGEAQKLGISPLLMPCSLELIVAHAYTLFVCAGSQATAGSGKTPEQARPESRSAVAKMLDSIPTLPPPTTSTNSALVAYTGPTAQTSKQIMKVIEDKGNSSAAVSRRIASKWPKPAWHAPWKL